MIDFGHLEKLKTELVRPRTCGGVAECHEACPSYTETGTDETARLTCAADGRTHKWCSCCGEEMIGCMPFQRIMSDALRNRISK